MSVWRSRLCAIKDGQLRDKHARNPLIRGHNIDVRVGCLTCCRQYIDMYLCMVLQATNVFFITERTVQCSTLQPYSGDWRSCKSWTRHALYKARTKSMWEAYYMNPILSYWPIIDTNFTIGTHLLGAFPLGYMWYCAIHIHMGPYADLFFFFDWRSIRRFHSPTNINPQIKMSTSVNLV